MKGQPFVGRPILAAAGFQPAGSRRFGSRRGSTMVESALVLMVFGVLMAGIMVMVFAGFVSNTVNFAAGRAARYAAVRGSASGHPATVADVRANALVYATPLDSNFVTVAVTWIPDNHPGSSVQVNVACNLDKLMPLSSKSVKVQSTARATIIQ